MLFAALLLQAGAAPPLNDSAGHRADWVGLPSAKALAECVQGAVPDFDLVLICRTAPADRVEDCAPDGAAPAPPPKVTRFALCVAKAYRIRAVDSEGRPVVGTTINVPLHFGVRR